MCLRLSGQGKIETLPVFAHPSDLPSRHACNQCVGLDVTGDHSASGDECMGTNGGSAHHGCIGTERGPLANLGSPVLVFTHDAAARVVHIGENNAGPAENIVFQRDRIVDADIVLNLDVVADHHVIADIDVLPERARKADPRPR